MDHAPQFSSVEPFSLLSESSLEQTKALARRRTYQAGEFVTHYADLWPFMVFVESGALEAVKESPEGRSLLVYKLTQGEVMWGLTFFNPAVKMPVSLCAAEETTLQMWPRDDILPILLEHSEALWSICSLLIQRVQIASSIVEDLAFQPVAGRLAKMLIEAYGDRGPEPLARDMTLDEMASRVGTTREMVCRILYKFADEKWIDITRTEFRLVDDQPLRRLAGRQE